MTPHHIRKFDSIGRKLNALTQRMLVEYEDYRRFVHPGYILIELLVLPFQVVMWYWRRVFRFRRAAPVIANIKYGWIK